MTEEPRRGGRRVRNGTGPSGRALSWPWHNDACRVPCNTRVLRRRVLRVAAGRVPVVRIHAAVPAERVSAVGPRVHAVPFGGRAAPAHTVPAQRQHTQGQAVGQGDRSLPAAPRGQLLRLLHGRRPTQLQPVLLVLPRNGNRIINYNVIKLI